MAARRSSWGRSGSDLPRVVPISGNTGGFGASVTLAPPDQLSDWFVIPWFGNLSASSSCDVRLIEPGGQVVARNTVSETQPNGPFLTVWNQGYWAVGRGVQVRMTAVTAQANFTLIWIRAPLRTEKGLDTHALPYWWTTLPTPAGPGGAWNDIGPSGGLNPNPAKPWVQMMSDAPAGQGVDVRLVDPAGATVWSAQPGLTGFLQQNRGWLLHGPGVRIQLRAAGAWSRNVIATWAENAGKC